MAAVVLGDPIRQTPVGEDTALVADTGFLIGPHDRPIVNEPLAIRTASGSSPPRSAAGPALGLAPALRGQAVDLLQAWPRAAVLRRHLTTLPDTSKSYSTARHNRRLASPAQAAPSECARRYLGFRI